jgi:5-methylcytosine-specific restriction protein A
MKPLPFYNTSAWRRKARKQALHDAGWRCQRCNASLAGGDGNVHHRKPYKCAPALATEPLNLMALCRTCHTKEHEAEKKPLMTNIDGTPTDPRHPWFRTSGGIS